MAGNTRKPGSDDSQLVGIVEGRKKPSAVEKLEDPTSAIEPEADYFDIVDEQREEYARARKSGDMPEPNAPVQMPKRFEDVTICAQGPCRWFFQLIAPTRIKGFVDDTDQLKHFVAATRRCLIGAVKLNTDDPAAASLMKNLATEAPYGAIECTHYAPWTDEELADLEERRQQARERARERREAVAVRDAARPIEVPAPEGPEPDDPFEERDHGE